MLDEWTSLVHFLASCGHECFELAIGHSILPSPEDKSSQPMPYSWRCPLTKTASYFWVDDFSSSSSFSRRREVIWRYASFSAVIHGPPAASSELMIFLAEFILRPQKKVIWRVCQLLSGNPWHCLPQFDLMIFRATHPSTPECKSFGGNAGFSAVFHGTRCHNFWADFLGCPSLKLY